MDWRIKAAVQKVLSGLPFGGQINDALQLTLGGLRDFEANVDNKVVGDWLVIASLQRKVGYSFQNRHIVEIGTGWYPTLPMCYFLSGAKSCHTFDIKAHLSDRLTFRMLRRLQRHLPSIAEAAGLPLSNVERAYADLLEAKSLETLLGRAGISYHAPADASMTTLPPQSIDLIYSNSVLEHVPADVISRLMVESLRLLRNDGIAVHSVACNDHYAFFDKSISFVNFLRYTDREWSAWNNSLLYQNRLRAPEFLSLASDAGLRLIHSERSIRPGVIDAIESGMPIAPRFRRFERQDLAATSIDFVVGPPDMKCGQLSERA